ncbi:MAG: glutathione S-transferase family protein, partial [Thermoleophilaceae bacterium]
MPNWAVADKNRGKDGEFVRDASKIRDWVTADGSSGFRAEPGRYHLYVSLACPWSQRAVIVRALKGLEESIGISYAHPYRDDRGWAFDGEEFIDTVNGWEFLSTAYDETDPEYSGR